MILQIVLSICALALTLLFGVTLMAIIVWLVVDTVKIIRNERDLHGGDDFD